MVDERQREIEEAKQAQKLARLEKRAGYAVACLQRFLTARHALDADFKTQAAVIEAEWEAKQRAAAEKARKRRKPKKSSKDPRKALTKKLTKLEKKKVKEVSNVWKGLLDDIDEQASKMKRFTTEDMPRAVQKLQPADLESLAAWAKTEGQSKKTFPAKNMNEVTIVLKNTIFFAARAASYEALNVPPAEKASAKVLRNFGANADHTAKMGFKPNELLAGGYTTEATIRACPDLKRLQAIGVTPKHLVGAKLDTKLGDLRGSQGAMRLRQAGYDAASITQAGLCTPYDLRVAGFSAEDMQAAGCTAEQLARAGAVPRAEQPAEHFGSQLLALLQSPQQMLDLNINWHDKGLAGSRFAGLGSQG